MSEFRIDGFDHVAIHVKDVEASVAWYMDVLGLKRRFEEEWGSHPAIVCAGESCVAMFPAQDGDAHEAIDHFAFRVDRVNFERAQEAFRKRGMEFRFADHAASHSVYVSDPDGHMIEITTYEV
jgi:catechol 2,3-dioxygenase-like lactoylglutathione lyase family enzyme